ncbi:MAG: mechanosensitive ion channel [archaeon]|nr:mechanosensitive ion channel [archaeon]MCP8313739.1 mechanosensitive ion channel [archaeon]
MSNTLNLLDMTITAFILIGAIKIAIAIIILANRYITKIAGKTRTRIDDYAVMIVKGPLTVFIVLFGIIIALRYWDAKYPGTLPSWIILNMDVITSIVSVLIAISVISFILNNYMGRRIQTIIRENPDRETTFRSIHRLIIYSIYLIGAAIVLTIVFPGLVGIIWSLAIGAGFLAIVVGLGAQKMIGNLLAGINVTITRPIRLGDAVMIREEFGFVEDITLRHTVIRTWDNRRMIIPNSVLDDEVIINYSLKDPTMLVPIFVQISYESDIDKAMKIMVDVAKKHPDCLPIGDLPNVVLMKFMDSGISLRLLSRAKDQPTAFTMARDLLYQIKKEFDANGIEIPYPRRYLVMDRKIEERISKIENMLDQFVGKNQSTNS